MDSYHKFLLQKILYFLFSLGLAHPCQRHHRAGGQKHLHTGNGSRTGNTGAEKEVPETPAPKEAPLTIAGKSYAMSETSGYARCAAHSA